ncbi:putative P450 monooxygenase [Polychaeton citri CBS 116435]|uniref:P450 monooxygenase n=1 Tax=Polychaeton citri CBS 116435 TaxID=1314669 RepID=A0A9P4UMQ5_9PEZI|nr:putative P450 monooxygenase [Polychaeton citri CBS 116435]
MDLDNDVPLKIAQVRAVSDQHGLVPSPSTAAIIVICLVLFATRVASSAYSQSQQVSVDNGSTKAKTVPIAGYWFPLLGHLPNMALDAAGFTKRLRSKYADGMYALNFGGTVHNVMYTPGLATALLNQKTSNADSEHVSNTLMKTIFGFPKAEQAKYDAALPEIMACYKHLLSEPELGNMVQKTASRICTHIADLVTFNASPVDQMLWERSSSSRPVASSSDDPPSAVEASLLPLIRDFIAHTANPAIMGSNFIQNNPGFFDDLWSLDRGFLFLAAGVPRWLPFLFPNATRAHIARRRMLSSLRTYHSAMEKYYNGDNPGQDWQDLDDVGALVKARMEVYRKYEWSLDARAATEQALLWATNANSNSLVFWIICRIYSDQDLLAMIREEIKPYATAVQPKQEFPVAEPPRLENFDVEALCSKCPLLKSCYIECLRLDTASWSLKIVKQDFVLQSRDKESIKSDTSGWLLRKGEYAHAAHDLHNTDPNYFPNPMTFKPDRHIKREGKQEATADMGSIRPYGGGSSMCKGRAFALKEVLMFVAAIVAVWDIDPVGGGKWEMPQHRKATGVYGTDDNIKVWVRRREMQAS